MLEIGKLFSGVLDGAVNQNAVIFDYGDAKGFSDIWDSTEDGAPKVLDSVTDKEAVVIVWDGRTPYGNDPEKLTDHLTPLDWALAFSIRTIKLLGTPGHSRNANFRIHIVDLTGTAHTTWAMRMRFQLLAEMPWVTMHAPLIPKTASRGTAVYRQGYEPFLEGDRSLLIAENGAWRLRKGGITLMDGSKQGQDLGDLARQWTASLTESRDHHDLNNIVGPWIIVSELDSEPEPVRPESNSLFSAFYIRLEWMGLLPGSSRKTGNKTEYEPPKLETFFDILAIDDELGKGWGFVLQALLGFESPPKARRASTIELINSNEQVNLYGCENPELLLERLGIKGFQESAIIDENRYRSRTFDSPCRGVENASQKPWLLVLDLHLFAGKKEQEWLRTLRKVSENLIDNNNLAWPGFGPQELIELDNWFSDPKPESREYDTALSLFPRLCALRWPSAPILLFSVTGRRTLIAKLAQYSNIFLAAPKPNVFAGDAGEQVLAFAESWRSELRNAIALVEVQKRLIELQKAQKIRSCETSGSSRTTKYRHLTIAFEESGNFSKDDYSAIGGVVVEVTADDEISAQESTVQFFEDLRKNKVNFYDHVPAYTEIVDKITKKGKVGELVNSCIPKNTNIHDQVAAMMRVHQTCRIFAFRCLIGKELYHNCGSQYSDGPYLIWLNATLELLLAEYLPSMDYDMDLTSMSIWLPTRWVDGNKDQAMRFDFNSYQGRNESLGGHSVAYALITKALAGRKLRDKTLEKVKSLKMRKIPYFKSPTNKGLGYEYVSAMHWYCKDCQDFPGRPANSVERLSDTWVEESFKPSKPSKPGHRKCNSHPADYLAADFSVAAHLADASLTNIPNQFPNAELGLSNIDLDFSFDVVAGDSLDDFLHVGRLFDRQLHSDGFKLAYKHGFFLNGIVRNRGAAIEKQLVEKLVNHATQIDGNTLIELAGLPIRGTFGTRSGNSSKNRVKQGTAARGGRTHKSNKSGRIVSPKRNSAAISKPQTLGPNANFLITIKIETGDNGVVDQVEQLFIQEAQKLQFFLKLIDITQSTSGTGKLDLLLSFHSDCDLSVKLVFRAACDSLKRAYQWESLTLKGLATA